MRCYKILLLNWKIFNVSIFDKRLIKKTKSFGGAVHEVKKNKTNNNNKENKNLTVPAAATKSLQSCLTLCDPIDGGPPGSPVPGILQARTLEWVAISFFNA